MTNKQHPVTILADTITEWRTFYRKTYKGNLSEIDYIAANSAQWGADQELEACCEWLSWRISRHMSEQLRATRRPKPQSETDLALTDLEHLLDVAKSSGVFNPPDNIRRCLERLKKLEEATND